MGGHDLRLSGIHELFREYASDTGADKRVNEAIFRPEIVCPKPLRAAKIPYFIDSSTRLDSRTKRNACSSVPKDDGDHACDILDIILFKDEAGNDLDASKQVKLLSSSPPARMSNPMVRDALFAKENSQFPSSIQTNAPRNSCSCSSSFRAKPRVRTEGFSCNNAEPSVALSALC